MTEGQPWYFEVSTTKFVVMSIVTFGIYDVYWFYQHWQHERARTGEDLSPFWRTLFAPIMAFSLFLRIDSAAEEAGVGGFPHSLYAFIYLVWMGSWKVPEPWVLLSLLAFLPLIPAQSAATRINRAIAPDAPKNDRYSLPNVAMIVIGVLMFLLVIAGMLLPVDQMPDGPVDVSV